MQTEPQPLKSFLLNGPVRAIAFFPDGNRIITGHDDGSARIWSLETGKEEGEALQGHTQSVTNLAVSKNGHDVVTSGADCKVLHWSIGRNWESHSRLLFSAPDCNLPSLVAFNSTDTIPNLFTSSSTDGLIDVWELKPNTDLILIKQITVPATTVISVHFSTDGLDLLALVCEDRSVKVFNFRSGEIHSEFDGYGGSIRSLAWFPATDRIVSAALKTIYVGEVQNDIQITETLSGHTQTIKSVTIHPEGKFILSGGGDKVLRVWDARTRVQIASSSQHPGAITSAIFSPDGKYILSISGTKTIFLWSTRDFGIKEESPASSPTRDSIVASDPLTEYFARYPGFDYDAEEPATCEFDRMCSFFGWRSYTPPRDDAYQDFRVALTCQFNVRYGTDVRSLQSWQSLCARLGTKRIPKNAGKCREIFSATHVNLVDLVHGDGRVKIFNSVHQLSQYTRSTGKFFPRDEASAGGLLRYLLRHIFDPLKDRDRGVAHRPKSRVKHRTKRHAAQ